MIRAVKSKVTKFNLSRKLTHSLKFLSMSRFSETKTQSYHFHQKVAFVISILILKLTNVNALKLFEMFTFNICLEFVHMVK